MPIVDDDPIRDIPVSNALRRSRGRWRIFAFLVLAVAVLIGMARFGPTLMPQGQTIARIGISGTITTSAERTAILRAIAEDDSIAAVIVAINSPGGTSAGGEELYESLREISEQKPVVSTIGELGASAAYMAAIGTDQIFSRNLSIIGSIGVYLQHIDAGALFDTIGIDLDKVASGPLKSEPDYDEAMTPEVRQVLEELVDSSFQYFLDLVIERRDLTRPAALALADGRVMSGIDGIASGLIDATGGQPEAIAWLSETHDIDPDLPVVSVWPQNQGFSWFDFIFSQARDALGGANFGLPLDGLVSLWQPSPH
ncbi:signal peptide peptidase SppA [Pelagibacterium luteolum]|uniref:Protease-4 n=1 Tax=Pelagibacterium luteolum TaxID=440168 RepID=A0A1G7SSA4_9HYPH|nr:signal peptide peptidase SppA [Pelagibacterium luteolum]SDG25903.1 protease-4 [Pelagibacterium luteolum]